MKRKINKNSFEKLCDKLESEYVLNENEVLYVKKYFIREIGEDIDILLKIKAEAQESDYSLYLSYKIAALSMVFSVIGIVKQFLPETGNQLVDMFINMLYLGMMFYATVKIGLVDKFKSVRKWRKYVIVVIDDRIAEVNKEKKKKIKKK